MNNFTLFFQLGLRHILEGYDHLLFLAGLVVVAQSWRSLLGVISAFTVAHSTTLVLSALGVISLTPSITESLIAASIAYVGIENVVVGEYKRRWVIAGTFGFVHGAGFSSHLTGLLKTILGSGMIWPPLLGFNIGIEIGQIIVISLLMPVLWVLRRYGKEHLVVTEFSRAIAAVGVMLIVWRIWGIQ